jgi:TetR/AcrR family transcriptional regulator, transcriptional repressor for nem operon
MYLCTVKNADTRERILGRMFSDIHKHGFQGLRADKVVAEMDITKGALYHYFPSKQSIGIAVIEEIIRPHYLAFYRELNQSVAHPVDLIQAHLQELTDTCTPENIALGCPLNNLIQEMSPLDETFRIRLKSVIDTMHQTVTDSLQRGQQSGFIRPDINPVDTAHFYLATLEGAYGIAKVQKSVAVFKASINVLSQFLNTLRK